MEVSDIINILLFVLPGLLVEKVNYRLDSPAKKESSDFKIMVNNILLSFPILTIDSWILAKRKKITSLSGFIEKFDDLHFSFTFLTLVLITAVALGVLKALTRNFRLKVINFIRSELGKMPISDKTCWQEFLTEKNEPRYLEVIQDGKSYKGFAGDYSTIDEDISIVLENERALYDYHDFEPDKLFTEVIGTYIDIERNVVIFDYDMSKYNNWVEEKQKEAETIS